MFEEEHAFMFRFFLCHLQWNPMRFPQGKIAKNGKLYNFAYHTLLQCGFCVSFWKIMNLFIGRRIYRRGEQYTAIIVTAAKAMTMMLAMKTFGGGFAIVLSLSMAGHFLWLTILIFVWKKLFLLPSICLAVFITATLHFNRKIYRIQCYYSNSNNANKYVLLIAATFCCFRYIQKCIYIFFKIPRVGVSFCNKTAKVLLHNNSFSFLSCCFWRCQLL